MKITSYFQFDRRERNGLTVLFAILVITCGLHYWASVPRELSDEERHRLESIADQFFSQFNDSLVGNVADEQAQLFLFNPNDLERSTWQELGLQDWQIDMIHKYESKGGAFRIKSDVLKMYCIDTSQYNALAPYIDLPEHTEAQEQEGSTHAHVEQTRLVNINLATAQELDELWGIGPVLSNRILDYRKSLGGYHSVTQLLEVYGVEQAVLDTNRSTLSVAGQVGLLNINELSAKELQQHPYLDWNAAGHIVQWRETNGMIDSIETLRSEHLILAEIYGKIAPYLTVE